MQLHKPHPRVYPLMMFIGEVNGHTMSTLMNRACKTLGMKFGEPDRFDGGSAVRVVVAYSSTNWIAGRAWEFSDSAAMVSFNRLTGLAEILWDHCPPDSSADDKDRREAYLLGAVSQVLGTHIERPHSRNLKEARLK